MNPQTAIGFQRWRNLLFLHWPVAVDALRPLVPPGLEIDTFEGRAYVGLLPFTMHDVRPLKRLPPVPTAAAFPETNLRTYVRHPQRGPGIWFFSLEAASTLAVLGARVGFFLPYFRARMRAQVQEIPVSAGPSGIAGTAATGATRVEVDYESRRSWPPPFPAALRVRYRAGTAKGIAAPGTLDHFLVERYRLFSRAPTGHLLTVSVRHQPYELAEAHVDHLEESLLAAAKIPRGQERTPDLYSPGVDVDVLVPERA